MDIRTASLLVLAALGLVACAEPAAPPPAPRAVAPPRDDGRLRVRASAPRPAPAPAPAAAPSSRTLARIEALREQAERRERASEAPTDDAGKRLQELDREYAGLKSDGERKAFIEKNRDEIVALQRRRDRERGIAGDEEGAPVARRDLAKPQVVRAPATAAGAAPKLADVVAKVNPTVVYIDAIGSSGERWLGSGFFVSQDGYLLTNMHVAAGEPARAGVKLEVKTVDGKRLAATYVDGDASLDLALLKVEGKGFAVASLGDSDKVRPGDTVFAIGNPLGLEHSVTKGIVSGLDRVRGFMQTDALINPGNSGGPAFDEHGRVIGIAVAKTNFPGVAFLIPINQTFPLLGVKATAKKQP